MVVLSTLDSDTLTADLLEPLVEPFAQRLNRAVRDKGTPLIVGLDPRLGSLPPDVLPEGVQERRRPASARSRGPAGRRRTAGCEPHLAGDAAAAAYERFCSAVIDAVAPLVPAVKPQCAFFEALGPAGTAALARVIASARRARLLVIVDGKRNDIGSTAEAYADAYLGGPWGGDALTVNPYLGTDALEPFVHTAVQRGCGVFVLVRTSNPGARRFQDLQCDGRPLYLHVAEEVERLGSGELRLDAAEARSDPPARYSSIGAVVGATYPEEIAQLRRTMPHAIFLLPGYGAQGATAADTAAAFDEQGFGAIINSSRGIHFAYEREPYRSAFGIDRWREAVAQAARDAIADIARHTPAGKLRGRS